MKTPMVGKFVIVIAALIAVDAIPVEAQSIYWTSDGPFGGTITVWALAIDPTTPTTLYAGTYGGVFRSLNGGSSWIAMNTGLTNLGVWALAIDPTTPTTLYAGTSVGAFKSTNGGSNWGAVNTGLTDPTNLVVLALAINPTTPTTLYAGTDPGGVFQSTNGGGSWSAVGLFWVNALSIDPTTPTTLYAGTESDGVFRSTNGGSSWSAVNTGLTYLTVSELAINPTTPTTLYAGTYRGGVFDTRRRVGSACVANSDCPSSNCVDGICCDPSCTGTCQSCALAVTGQPSGTCAPVGVGLQTSNNCNTGSLACDGSTGPGSCTTLTEQGQACTSSSQCVTGNCIDGICCGPTCSGTCQSCATAKTGLVNGTCGSVTAGQQSTNSCKTTGLVGCNGGYGPGSCLAAACPANAGSAPTCACNAGYTGTLTWTGTSWMGSCSLAACPANASGAPTCSCNSGYSGTLTWNGSSWTGTCGPPGTIPALPPWAVAAMALSLVAAGAWVMLRPPRRGAGH